MNGPIILYQLVHPSPLIGRAGGGHGGAVVGSAGTELLCSDSIWKESFAARWISDNLDVSECRLLLQWPCVAHFHGMPSKWCHSSTNEMNDPKALGYFSHTLSPPVVRADIFNEMSLGFTSSSFRGRKKIELKTSMRSKRRETTGVGYHARLVKGRINELKRRR